MITIGQAKKYMVVDSDDCDEMIQDLIEAADKYIKNECGEDYIEDQVSNLAQCILVAHWYENREAVGKADQLAFSLGSLLRHIKYCSLPQTTYDKWGKQS